ncbi:MAG: arginine--tRNA ligase [Solirubrobacterales bacterium]
MTGPESTAAHATEADPERGLRGIARDAAAALAERNGGSLGAEPTLERPPQEQFGDYSTNAAMLLAPVLRASPRDIASQLAEELTARLGDRLERTEVAGPGFVNLHLADGWFRDALVAISEAGGAFGRARAGSRERVLVEFVSANPTGPLTAAGGRHAAYGDALARVLEAAGHEVAREYYVNDYGAQTARFAASIAARMTGDPVPEDGYSGDYVVELATDLKGAGHGSWDQAALERAGVEAMVGRVRSTLERFGAYFDAWVSERSLHERGSTTEALERLEQAGHTYTSDGALWLRSTAFGDDKDRVLRRSGGETTYFAADVAYHEDKLRRGYDRLVDVWGADHHGYMARVGAALEALGADPDRLEIVIMQLVHIVTRGERAQMSKRRGEFVTLDELIDDIGVDAARFFMLQRSHDTALDLDLDLAREQSNDNPVYYVQYAHARICSILRKAGSDRVQAAVAADQRASEAVVEPGERRMIKRLAELPAEVSEAAERRSPHRLTAYTMALAADFHGFYRDCQVVGAEGDGVQDARLALCVATRDTIAGTLALLGVGAPEQM